MLPKYRSWTTPAAPASADPSRKVMAIVRLMSTPISAAASRSEAVERIARPVLVRDTKSWRPIISTTAMTITKMLIQPMLTPKSRRGPTGG